MSTLKTLALAPLAATMLLTAVTAAPAYADDRTCRGTIGAADVDGNVIVPAGASCTLVGTRVDGNVHVRSGATLTVRGASVGGNVQAENHRSVVIRSRVVDDVERRTRVGGSVQLEQGGGGVVLRAVVGGDVQLFSNDGRFEVRRNSVDGNLQCKSNIPAPVGGGNVVQGNKEDQCRSL